MYIQENCNRLCDTDTVYCGICSQHRSIKELKFWNDNGCNAPRLLCPGCDNTLAFLLSDNENQPELFEG